MFSFQDNEMKLKPEAAQIVAFPLILAFFLFYLFRLHSGLFLYHLYFQLLDHSEALSNILKITIL